MFDSGILEVAIGVAFVFLLVSTVCSALREGIEALLKTRAVYLEYAIRELLHDRQGDGLAKSLFNHPFVYSLFLGEYTGAAGVGKPGLWQRGRNLPSYIPAKSFALALIDLTARGPSTDAASADPGLTEASFASLRANVHNLQNVHVQRAMLAAIDSAQGDLERVRANLEAWYDGAMDRVSGWYKRSTHGIIFALALLVVGALNVNTIAIANHLYRDGATRDALVAAAGSASNDLGYKQAARSLAELRLPIGWSEGWESPRSPGQVVELILGLLITAFAATLGAPFWFDVLNRVMVIRATVKPHEKSPEEGSEDRQLKFSSGNGAHPPEQPRGSTGGQGVGASRPPPPPPPRSSVRPALGAQLAGGHADDDDAEGCDHPIDDAMPDEDLPAATGGVS